MLNLLITEKGNTTTRSMECESVTVFAQTEGKPVPIATYDNSGFSIPIKAEECKGCSFNDIRKVWIPSGIYEFDRPIIDGFINMKREKGKDFFSWLDDQEEAMRVDVTLPKKQAC